MSQASRVAHPLPSARTDDEVFWVDGGLLHGWAVSHSRAGHPLSAGEKQARFMFTQSKHTSAPQIQQWLDHLASMGVEADRGSARVFSRLVVRQRSLALTAQPCAELRDATDNAREVSRRASTLTVSLGFAPSETIPKWVVCADDVPVLVGLPQHHLVRVSDPRESLAALLSGAHVRTRVHEIT